MDLQKAYNNILTGGGQLLSNIGKGVSSAIGNVGNYISQDIQRAPQVQAFNNIRQFTATPQFQPGYQNVKSAIQNNPVTRYVGSQPLISSPGINVLPQLKMPTLGQYVNGQIVKNLEQGLPNIFQAKNLGQAGQGALQTAGGVFGATPEGFLFNTTRGAIAGGINAAKGQPIDQALTQGMTQNSSIGSAITKNPFLAMGIDLASGNPKGTVEGLVKGGNFLKAVKGVEGESQIISNQAAKEIAPIISKIDVGKYISPEEYQKLQNTAKSILSPKTKADIQAFNKLSPQDLAREIKTAYTQDQNFAYRQMPGYQVPGMGLVGKRANAAKANQEAVLQGEQTGVQPQLPGEPQGQYPTQTSAQTSSVGSIPKNMTKVEAKKVAATLGIQGNTPSIPTGEKPLGVVDTIQTSGQTSKQLQQAIKGAYNVAGNKETLAAAQKRIATDPNGAYQFALSTHNAEANATAILLAKQYELQGQPEMAANLMMQKAKQALQAGQGNQIYSMWDKLSPETVGQTAAKTIENYNATAKTKIPALTADQYQGFVDKAKAIQGMTDPRQKGIATQKLLESIGRLIPSSIQDKGVALWRAGLLTGFRTPGKILVSHAVSNAAEQVKNIPAKGVDLVSSLFTGKQSLTPTLRGNVGGFRQGISDAVDNLVHGYNAPNSGGMAKDFTNQVNFGNSLFGKAAQAYVDSIGRLHGSLYKPFFGAQHLNSLFDQALTEAGNKGLTGVAKENFVQDFIKNPPQAAAERAIKEAEYTTFQNKTVLGSAASGAVQRGGVVGKVIAPFTQIPSSIAMKLVDYSPVGAVKTIIEQIHNGQFDQRAFSQGLGRSITGTGIMAIGAALYNQGMMTLGYPTSPAERALWQQQGKTENSILINGKWRSLATLGPTGDALSVGANFAAGMKGNQKTPGSIANAGISAGSAGLSTIANAPYLQGINALTSTLQDPQRSGTTFAENMLGSVVPTAVSNIATATDPLARQSAKQSGNITNAITNKIPVLREQNAPQLDVLGNPVPRDNGMVGSLLDPFYSSINKQTPITNELQRLQDSGFPASLSPLSKNQTINGVKTVLTPTQLDALTKTSGPQVAQAINTLIQQPDYQALGDQEKANAINNVVTQVRKQVRGTVDLNNPQAPTQTSNITTSTNTGGIGGKYTIVNPDTGSVKTIDLSQPVDKPQLTGNTELDKQLVSKYNSALTTRANDIVTLYKNNKIDAATAEKALGEIKQQKTVTAKPKKVSVKVPKIPKLKLVTPRATKVKASRVNTYTLKAPKLKIAPIPRFGSSLPKAKKVRLSA